MSSDPILIQLLIGVLAGLILDKAKALNKDMLRKRIVSGRIEFSLSISDVIVILIVISLLRTICV